MEGAAKAVDESHEYASRGLYVVRLLVERSPLALSRVLGLVATVYMVPQVVECFDERESLRIRLTFSGEEPRRIDLLCRKIAQLTETIDLELE